MHLCVLFAAFILNDTKYICRIRYFFKKIFLFFIILILGGLLNYIMAPEGDTQMIVSVKDKLRLEGDAIVLVNQIEMIISAFKDGLQEGGETQESAKDIILLAVENAFKYQDYYRYTTVDKQEEALENELMLLLKQDVLNEVSEKRTYMDVLDNIPIKENIRRIRR